MKRLKVGVLMGGKSIEHEVSFNSGRTVCDHLDTQRYEVVPLYQKQDGTIYLLPWHFLHRGKTTDFSHRLKKEALSIAYDELSDHVDFIYIATHGRYAEDGTLQGMLEILGIPYLGAKVFGSALGMDKALQKTILAQHGIDTPQGISVEAHEIMAHGIAKQRLKDANLKYPLIVKPHFEGSSLGMTLVKSEDELVIALQKACFSYPDKPQAALIEECLQGMEFSCITLTDYRNDTWMTLPVTEIVLEEGSDFFCYEQKYMPGRARKFTPARCDEAAMKRIQEACIKVMEALEFSNLSRIDGFLTHDNRIVIIDPNSLSGMGPSTFLFNQAAHVGLNHTKLINHIIETELHAYGMLDALELQEAKEQEMNTKPKLRVAVLLGGASHEREISLESGRNIVYKLSPQKYATFPVFVDSKHQLHRINDVQLVQHATKEIEESLTPEQKIAWSDLPALADFVFIGLHGGIGENGSVQGSLELLGLPYNGSGVAASALCMDKFKTNEFLKECGFEVPQSLLINKEAWKTNHNDCTKKVDQLTFPLIIKPADDGCSMGVQKIDAIEELPEALATYFTLDKDTAMIEESITGMELTVGIIGNDTPMALPASQAIATQGILSIEEKFLPGAGENQTPAPLPNDAHALVKATIEKAYKALNLKGYARIDCFYQDALQSATGRERVIILEVNTLPGMTPATCIFHQAAELGIKPMDFVDQLIDLGLKEHAKPVSMHQPQAERQP